MIRTEFLVTFCLASEGNIPERMSIIVDFNKWLFNCIFMNTHRHEGISADADLSTLQLVQNTLNASSREQLKSRISANRPKIEECKVSVLGSGNFGAGMANVLSRNLIRNSRVHESDTELKVKLYFNPHFRDEEKHQEALRKVHLLNSDRKCDSIEGVTIHAGIQATLDLADAIRGRDQILVAVPSAKLLEFLDDFSSIFAESIQKGDVRPDVAITSLIKGLPEVHQAQGNIIFPAEVIENSLREAGIRVGIENGIRGVQVLCAHGAAFGTDIAMGAPYSLAIGNGSKTVEDYANQLKAALIKSNSLVTVEPNNRDLIEFGAVSKNFVALLTNFVIGYASRKNYKFANAAVRAFMNSSEELNYLCGKIYNTQINPLSDFRPISEDVKLSTWGAQEVPEGASLTKSRNARFGVELPRYQSLEEIYKSMSKKSNKPITVEGVSIIRGLYDYVISHGISDEFPLLTSLFTVLAVRETDRRSGFGNMREDEISDLIARVDEQTYKLSVAGQRVKSLRTF